MNPPPSCGTCGECSRKLVRQRAWILAAEEVRASWRASGFIDIGRSGLCRTCYMRAYRKHGPSPQPRPRQRPRLACPRCGLPSLLKLCADCADVAADLNEVERWVA